MSLPVSGDKSVNQIDSTFDHNFPFLNKEFVKFIKEKVATITDIEEKVNFDNLEEYHKHEMDILKLDYAFEKMTETPFSVFKECVEWGDSIIV